MKRFVLITPFAFTLASLLQLNYVASIVASPDQILRLLAVLWTLLVFLLWPAYRLTGDWTWTSLLLTIFVMGFYFSSSFFSTVIAFTIIGEVSWLAFARVRRIKADLVHFSLVLTGVSIFFICYSTVVIGSMLLNIPWRSYKSSVNDAGAYSLNAFSSLPIQRDIYFIVLDDYARSDILLEMFGFDNSEFITYLQGLGFVVPAANHSNYPTTHLSLASTLNMEYIQILSPGLEKSYNRWLMAPLIDRSRARALLEKEGYQTISISTNWSITDNTTTDTYYHPYPVMLNDFEGFVLDSTPLNLFGSLLKGFASVQSVESQRKIVLYNFEALTAVSEIPGPKFVFAHIISPHPPFVFDRNGKPVEISYPFSYKDADEFPGSRDEYRQGYLEQVQFVNNSLRKVIADILDKSKIPPIIILQADHGSGMLTDFTSAENTCIKERFSPFAAYYMPDSSDQSIPPGISSVNIFRIVFNEYFGAELALLESRQYFYKEAVSFYDFENVTERISDVCTPP